jgi:hypothetical protein
MSTQTLIMKSTAVMERRRHPRLRLSYLLRLFRPGQSAKIETTTEDLSCDGFYCISDHPVQPHERIECELLIPSEQLGESSEPDLVLRCRAEVVRVVPDRLAPRFGVACRLEDYTINRNMSRPDMAVCNP